jgi:hypothetical protein
MKDILRSATLWNPARPTDIQDLLESNGYVRGAFRAWDQAGTLVIIDVMAFNKWNGSDAFLNWAINGLYASSAWADRGTISEVNNGTWAELAHDGRRELWLVFGKGEFGVVVRVSAPGTANMSLLRSVAINQFNRLP